MNKKILCVALAGIITAAASAEVDYTTGVFIVNEDWFGHQNSTVNYLLPDDPDGEYWHYRVIQTENPGMELGCTNQFGAIWNGKFYFIAKQEKDGGATITGGRITVADAKTMKVIYQNTMIDPSGSDNCDGRGFVGIDAHKGYISSSNGIWVFDLDALQVTGQVTGTENASGNMYLGQCGSMVVAAGKVFAAHQSAGLLVIDPATDTVIETISMDFVSDGAGIGSVVVSKDGSVWASVTADVGGSGSTYPAIVRVDPVTMDRTVIEIPDGIYPPSNSWYAWTPDTFCASAVNNCLYWTGGPNSWFSGYMVFKYNIDTAEFENIIDLQSDGEGWNVYGCSLRVHPVSDEIYTSLYKSFGSEEYVTRRYTSAGEKIQDYSMIENYWFPSLPVFPEKNNSGVGMTAVDPVEDDVPVYYNLQGQAVDADNLVPGIYVVRTLRSAKKIIIR